MCAGLVSAAPLRAKHPSHKPQIVLWIRRCLYKKGALFKEKMRRCLLGAPPGHSFCGKFLSVEQFVKQSQRVPPQGAARGHGRAQSAAMLAGEPSAALLQDGVPALCRGAAGASCIDSHYPQTSHEAACLGIALPPETSCFSPPPPSPSVPLLRSPGCWKDGSKTNP